MTMVFARMTGQRGGGCNLLGAAAHVEPVRGARAARRRDEGGEQEDAGQTRTRCARVIAGVPDEGLRGQDNFAERLELAKQDAKKKTEAIWEKKCQVQWHGEGDGVDN
eukprot:612779-Rhodomonas_salina.1